ncbi:MAG: FixH family protein [Campylobacterales bacterium]|nr:FixH family protein [Campylobacterales bacterium]
MSKSSGRIWPYAIGASITVVFGFCVATIMVTNKVNIQESDAYMTHYQDADARANELIEAQIAFNKKYNIEYITDGISEKDCVIKYKLTDKADKPVNDAKIVVSTSRPETSEYNQVLENPEIEDGVYSFSGANFPKVGVWNIIAKVQTDDASRFYNIKADTRIKEVFEF